MLEYQIDLPSGVSLDPMDSDSMGNTILMKHLVGTLVRFRNGGQFEPYLAESFSPEADGRRWKFQLRSDLYCQDGDPITSTSYISGLTKVLRMYAKLGPIPIFSDLEGWTEFVNGGDLKGVTSDGARTIDFHFMHAAGEGFLEYLSMPYYGYLAPANFNGDQWKSAKFIVSSGPYQLQGQIDDPKTVILHLRKNWLKTSASSPTTVVYKTKITEAGWLQKRTIIQTNLKSDQATPGDFRKILGPPDIVRTIILNPMSPSKFFENVNNRRYLQNAVLKMRASMTMRSSNALIATSFYPSNKLTAKQDIVAENVVAPTTPLLVYTGDPKDEESYYIRDLIIKTLNGLNWPYLERGPKDFVGKTMTGAFRRDNFDISLTGVVAGNVLEPWTANMMFCTSLGATFPDPSSRICSFLNGLLNSKTSYSIQAAGAKLSNIVDQDAAVLPILHARTTWYFSQDLDVSQISGDLIIPSFEEVGVNK